MFRLKNKEYELLILITNEYIATLKERRQLLNELTAQLKKINLQ